MSPRITDSAGVAFLLLLTALPACRSAPQRPGDGVPRLGDEISVAGQLFHSGTRVVLWNDPGGYDAYRAHCRFAEKAAGPREEPTRLARFGSFRRGLSPAVDRRVRERGWTLEDLREVVTQVVLHYDDCGTSRRCFEVLHDIRGLSCHFLLDLDGTVYQTLDVKERAWHAAEANDASIGIEIAHPGARASIEELSGWYEADPGGTRIILPPPDSDGPLAKAGALRPARPEPIRGVIHGRSLVQYDFTEAQYRALERLLQALTRILPGIRADVPREPDGRRLETAFPDMEALKGYRGLLGHLHVTSQKVDPGPAFDWDRILRAVRERAR